MDEYITRNNVISAACFGCNQEFSDKPCEPNECAIRQSIMALPTADVVPRAMIAEIFGEIENIARTVGFPETLVNGMIVNRILDGLHLDSQDFAELKKKYIGKDTNVTTNTEN